MLPSCVALCLVPKHPFLVNGILSVLVDTYAPHGCNTYYKNPYLLVVRRKMLIFEQSVSGHPLAPSDAACECQRRTETERLEPSAKPCGAMDS
jgi:hypothetical protein